MAGGFSIFFIFDTRGSIGYFICEGGNGMGKKKKVCAALLGVTLLSGVMAGPASAEVKTPTLASVTAEAKKEVPKDSVDRKSVV